MPPCTFFEVGFIQQLEPSEILRTMKALIAAAGMTRNLSGVN
jgi:hypothetical protein